MYKTMADVRAANAAAGHNWFSRDTMRSWKTRIETSLIKHKYFVSSEDEFALDGRKPARIYNVREVQDDGSIKTLKSHLKSLEDAKDYIKDLE